MRVGVSRCLCNVHTNAATNSNREFAGPYIMHVARPPLRPTLTFFSGTFELYLLPLSPSLSNLRCRPFEPPIHTQVSVCVFEFVSTTTRLLWLSLGYTTALPSRRSWTHISSSLGTFSQFADGHCQFFRAEYGAAGRLHTSAAAGDSAGKIGILDHVLLPRTNRRKTRTTIAHNFADG